MPNNNEFVEKLKSLNNEGLINSFNEDVGKKGWVGARGRFLGAMHDELTARGFDVSLIIDGDSMSVSRKIALSKDNKVVPFGTACGRAIIRVPDSSYPEAISPTRHDERFEAGASDQDKNRKSEDNKTRQIMTADQTTKNDKWKEDQRQLSKFMRHLNSGGKIEDADEETKIWWMNRY